MKRIVFVYGIIAGFIVAALMLVNINFVSHADGTMDFTKGMILGYASMLIALSMVYVGIRQYRDKYNGGIISFGKSFKIGILIVLIASTMYVIAWMIDYYFFIPDFPEKYAAQVLDNMRADGASQAAIDKEAKNMDQFIEWYKNPLFVALMTYVEILPVGLAVTLISALILKRKSVAQEL